MILCAYSEGAWVMTLCLPKHNLTGIAITALVVVPGVLRHGSHAIQKKTGTFLEQMPSRKNP